MLWCLFFVLITFDSTFLTSSPRDAEVKGDLLKPTIDPPIPVVIVFILSVLRRGRNVFEEKKAAINRAKEGLIVLFSGD